MKRRWQFFSLFLSLDKQFSVRRRSNSLVYFHRSVSPSCRNVREQSHSCKAGVKLPVIIYIHIYIYHRSIAGSLGLCERLYVSIRRVLQTRRTTITRTCENDRINDSGNNNNNRSQYGNTSTTKRDSKNIITGNRMKKSKTKTN